jgi:hypothetical protein
MHACTYFYVRLGLMSLTQCMHACLQLCMYARTYGLGVNREPLNDVCMHTFLYLTLHCLNLHIMCLPCMCIYMHGSMHIYEYVCVCECIYICVCVCVICICTHITQNYKTCSTASSMRACMHLSAVDRGESAVEHASLPACACVCFFLSLAHIYINVHRRSYLPQIAKKVSHIHSCMRMYTYILYSYIQHMSARTESSIHAHSLVVCIACFVTICLQ